MRRYFTPGASGGCSRKSSGGRPDLVFGGLSGGAPSASSVSPRSAALGVRPATLDVVAGRGGRVAVASGDFVFELGIGGTLPAPGKRRFRCPRGGGAALPLRAHRGRVWEPSR